MSRVFNLIKSVTTGKYNFQLYDVGGSGSMRYRLMRHNTIENRYDTFSAATKEEFEKTLEDVSVRVKWEEPHGHQVIKENENVGVSEVVYQRLPPHPMTPKTPKGEVVKDTHE
jgi:hypothetical protein